MIIHLQHIYLFETDKEGKIGQKVMTSKTYSSAGFRTTMNHNCLYETMPEEQMRQRKRDESFYYKAEKANILPIIRTEGAGRYRRNALK